MTKMSDVARLAGVSTATVSRVLSGPAGVVKPETRERVLDAVEELGYFPNRLARNLRERSARILALVISDISNPFFVAVVRGCEDAARERGYSVIIANTDEVPEREVQRLLDMLAEGVAGVVLASTGEHNEGLEQVARSGIPIVALDRRIAGLAVDTVTTDGVAGARTAVEHLISLGHQRIAFIDGPPAVSTMTERREGYLAALRSHGLRTNSTWMRRGDLKADSGYLATLELLDLPEPPTAIFVANNLMAAGALNAISKRRLSVPNDISIVCFDDLLESDLIGPGIAAVVQPTYQMGLDAVGLILRRVEEPKTDTREVVLAAELVPRGSMAAPSR